VRPKRVSYSKPPKAPGKPQSSFGEFEASELFCSRCRRAVPVRKRLLLILPEGDKYEYLCAHCSNSLGTKMEFEERDVQILI
jgi:hypothetical protein